MKGADQKTCTPIMGGVFGGGFGMLRCAPKSRAKKNQNNTAKMVQSAAEMKNGFGLGKNDLNMKPLSGAVENNPNKLESLKIIASLPGNATFVA